MGRGWPEGRGGKGGGDGKGREEVDEEEGHWRERERDKIKGKKFVSPPAPKMIRQWCLSITAGSCYDPTVMFENLSPPVHNMTGRWWVVITAGFISNRRWYIITAGLKQIGGDRSFAMIIYVVVQTHLDTEYQLRLGLVEVVVSWWLLFMRMHLSRPKLVKHV